MGEKGRQPLRQNDIALMVAYASLMEIQFELTRGFRIGAPFERMELSIRKALPDHLRELSMQRALDAHDKKQACPDCAGKRVVEDRACGTCISCSKCRGSGWIILDLKGNTEKCLGCNGTGYRDAS